MRTGTCVILTVDAESGFFGDKVIPPSKMIHGEVEGERFGFARIMDVCESRGFKATFFLDVLEQRWFGDEIRLIALSIHRRGHDVQLHTHPIWAYGRWKMTDFTFEEQARIIEEGCELIRSWLGRCPVADRAGSFAADRNTLKALRENGILIDSSLCHGYRGCKLSSLFPSKNRMGFSEGVIEIPATVFTELKLGPYKRYRCLDINACSLKELIKVVKLAEKGGLRFVVVCLHSFSFLRWDKGMNRFLPNGGELRKFERFLGFLREEDVEVITMEECSRRLRDESVSRMGVDRVPHTGYLRTLMRAFKHFNRSWKNRIFAVSSAAAFLSLIALVIKAILAYVR